MQRTATARIKDFFNNRQFYTDAWQEAQKQLREKYEGNQEALDAFDEWINSTISYNADPMANDKTMQGAILEAIIGADTTIQNIAAKASLGGNVIDEIYNQLAKEIQPLVLLTLCSCAQRWKDLSTHN